jgi:DNA repair exonuclease SbcCD ATPase subunit
MSCYRTGRCCTFKTQNETVAPADETDDDKCCAICLDPMTEPLANVTLQCGHVFHGSCIVDSLRRDSRCPICRDTPHKPDTDSFYSEDDEFHVEDRRISRGEALKLAKRAGKTDKKIAKRVQTINKWKASIKEHRKAVKDCYGKLRPLEDKLEEKIETHNNRLWDAFDEKNRTLINQLAEHKKALGRATG